MLIVFWRPRANWLRANWLDDGGEIEPGVAGLLATRE
jgi:hypothetical protein